MQTITIGLLGNPNSGKTTLFNALTGAKQRVGNWPGVTVEQKTGEFAVDQTLIKVVDLPGVYQLNAVADAASLDEQIACDYMFSDHADLIINIIDASNLERNLYLTTQLLEMDLPVIVALNMIDVANKRGINIDTEQLAQALGCPVVALRANKKHGLQALKQTIIKHHCYKQPSKSIVTYPKPVTQAVKQLGEHISQAQPAYQSIARCLALRLLADDDFAHKLVGESIYQRAKQQQLLIQATLDEDADIIIADARYSMIHELVSQVMTKGNVAQTSLTKMLDRIILHRFLGIPIFLGVMYVMFFFAINVGGAFQDFFDIGSNTLLVQGLGHWLQHLGSPTWLTAILAAGLGKGINTTITFIPVIGGMFLFLSFLEGSGYMARAAFVMDRFMRAIGLPGKSFVPMIVGFGCNVPAIMAARTLENKRDRILTILMSPFMSCGARLAIFAVFTAAFFPVGGQNIVFALYMIGILMAVVTGLILRKTLLRGEPSPLVMELPPYHLPTLRALTTQTWQRLKKFLFKAGKLIIPICMLIGALNYTHSDQQQSVLAAIGRTVTPVFAPMGIEQNNWPATVGLVTGILAKEVVVGTLNTLYTQAGHLHVSHGQHFNLGHGLMMAVKSIPNNLLALKDSLLNPVLASAPPHEVNKGVYGVMMQRFNGQVGAFAYLLFVLLYFPCVSATSAMVREANRGWTLFSVAWTTGLAYGVAVSFYQAATLWQHPMSSIIWLGAIASTFLITIFNFKRYALSPSRTLAVE